MNKICLIYQPCGLGDILFIQKICKEWKSKGFEIILPVVYELEWLNNYIDGVSFISWDDKDNKLTHLDTLPSHVSFPYKEKYNPYGKLEFSDDFVYLNFFTPPQGRVMEFKYRLLNMDYSDWADYLTFNRNIEKENELFYNVLGLKDGDDYVFINRNYQTRPNVLTFDRISNNPSNYNNKKIVELSILDGFTLFDWCKVLENASEIHMIETSLNYMLESPQMRDKITNNLYLYHRYGSFYEVDYLFKLPWKYII